MKRRVRVQVDGKSFTLVGDATEEHMEAVANYVNEKMIEVRRSTVAGMDAALAYVLTAINVADDYLNLLEGTTEQTQIEKIQELERKLAAAEREKRALQRKLDDYAAALEGDLNYSRPTGHTAQEHHQHRAKHAREDEKKA